MLGYMESRSRVAYLCGGERVVEEVVYGGSDADGNPKPSYASAVCEKSMNDRKRAKASGDALMANFLKICANSLYGSTGNSRSVSYSPLCSMAVTGAGRWLLGVMMVSSRCSAPLAVGVVRVIIGKRRDDGTFEQGEAGRG